MEIVLGHDMGDYDRGNRRSDRRLAGVADDVLGVQMKKLSDAQARIAELETEADRYEDGVDWIQRALQAEARIAELEKDAARYRDLASLVEFGKWSVGAHRIVDSYGNTNDTFMDDKAHMDTMLDANRDDARSCRIAMQEGEA